MILNPFKYTSASKLAARQAVELWCDDGRLRNAQGPENCFINGHRGTGKTMLFRVMRLDAQRLFLGEEPPAFFSVYLPVRDSELSATEFLKLNSSELRHVIAENQLCLLLLKELVMELQEHIDWVLPDQESQTRLLDLLDVIHADAFRFSSVEQPALRRESVSETLHTAINILKIEAMRTFAFVQNLLNHDLGWSGPLYTFERTLLPIAVFVKQQRGCPVYLMIDDADDLPVPLKEVLNTWIARRSTEVIFKVSTMYGYRVFRTRNGSAIQHPHDFYLYEVATRFVVGEDNDYLDLVRRITEKRLKQVGQLVRPEDFFPEDTVQQRAIEALGDELRGRYAQEYSGRAVTDRVYRHLRSEYLKKLHAGKSMGTFIYCGFETIALVSSGLVRDFIRAAGRMYELSLIGEEPPGHIPAGTQNKVLRDMADELLDEIGNAAQKRVGNESSEDWKQVRKLVEALGTRFKSKMLSGDSERRVFSFAFQDDPDSEMERWLQLALEEGFLIKGVIARKEGGGRRTLYVLTRRLAPVFELDPSAYAGYLSVTSMKLRALMESREPLKQHSDQLVFDLEHFGPEELVEIMR